MTEQHPISHISMLPSTFSNNLTLFLLVVDCNALSIAKKIRLSDFQSQFFCPSSEGSDFTLSVQVGVHPGLRDNHQSFVPTPESPRSVFNFVAMDEAL